MIYIQNLFPAIDYAKALKYSLKYFEAQKSGDVTSDTDFNIAWRGNSALQDEAVGGFYTSKTRYNLLSVIIIVSTYQIRRLWTHEEHVHPVVVDVGSCLGNA